MEADWSNMPVDILDQIAAKLISIQDLLAFSAVCHPWHSAYTHVKSKWIPQMPWLMLSENTKDNSDGLRKFFDPSSSKCYQLKIPKTFICWGSAYGWVVSMDLDFEIFMFNPLTGVRVKLPSAYTLPRPMKREYVDKKKDVKELCVHWLDRVILLKIPQGSNVEDKVEEEEFVAVSISGCTSCIGICRPNDSIWTPIEKDNSVRFVSDVTYWNGVLFLMDEDGAICYVELNDGDFNQKPLISTHYSPPPPRGVLLRGPFEPKLYLTELSGNLLAIFRVRSFVGDADPLEAEDPIYVTQAFGVYKINKETKAWEYLKDLEDVSIFVGSNTTMAIKVRESTKCRRNCIYFTDDNSLYWKDPKDLGGHDIGIFSVGDNMGKDRFSTVVEPLYQGENSHSCFCCPFWFVPNL